MIPLHNAWQEAKATVNYSIHGINWKGHNCYIKQLIGDNFHSCNSDLCYQTIQYLVRQLLLTRGEDILQLVVNYKTITCGTTTKRFT